MSLSAFFVSPISAKPESFATSKPMLNPTKDLFNPSQLNFTANPQPPRKIDANTPGDGGSERNLTADGTIEAARDKVASTSVTWDEVSWVKPWWSMVNPILPPKRKGKRPWKKSWDVDEIIDHNSSEFLRLIDLLFWEVNCRIISEDEDEDTDDPW